MRIEMRLIAIIGLALLAVFAAIFACFVGLASVIAGDANAGLLWVGAAMFAILYAAFMITSLREPKTKHDGINQADREISRDL